MKKVHVLGGGGLISIIVPVYNTGKYLAPCLESMLLQSYERFEVLLVDDGSADDSLQVCNRYASIDKRFHVFHQRHGGVSRARNVGLHQAKGEFLTFVDADDRIGNNYLEQMVRPLLMDDSIDVALSSIVRVSVAGEKKIVSGFQDGKVYRGHAVLRMLLDPFQGNWYVWSKLYRFRLFEDIFFDEWLKTGEDFDVAWKVFERARQAVYVSEAEYRYVQRENSITSNVPFDENIKHFRNFCAAMYSPAAQEDEILLYSMRHRFCLYFWSNIKEEVRRLGGDYSSIRKYFDEFRHIMMDVVSAMPEGMLRHAICREFSGSFEEFIEQREDVYEFLETPNKRYIYGAGKIAERAARDLIDKGVAFEAFVVSDGQLINPSSILGHKVINLGEVMDSKDSVVVMALGSRSLVEVLPAIENKDFKKIYFW